MFNGKSDGKTVQFECEKRSVQSPKVTHNQNSASQCLYINMCKNILYIEQKPQSRKNCNCYV